MAATGATREILADVELVNADEAAQVCAAVHDERAHWTTRRTEHPFFTLGTAAYLDVPRVGFQAYLEMVKQTNPLLASRFGWLHDRIRRAVSDLVGAPASYDERLALPGFHIFQFDFEGPQPSASVHFDMQYEQIDWTLLGTPDRTQQLSLTATFALPASGGGLLVWNVNRLEIEQMDAEVRRAHMAANRNATYHAYTVGHLVVHSGHQLHQIASTKDRRSTDERITMQAHALPVDGRWLIYW